MTVAGKRFVILATPRSGSNWLCTLLDSHPDILCHHELFNPDGVHIAWSQRGEGLTLGDTVQRSIAPLDLLARTWSHSLGRAAVGFKLNIGQSEPVFEAVLGDPTISKVLVSRRNRVRAYLSERIAELSGQWESYPDSYAPAHCGPVEIAVDALVTHAARNRAYRNGIRERLSRLNQQALEVAYESIGELTTQRHLLAFLGVDPNQPLRGQTRKMNPRSLETLIVNFAALQTELAGSDLAQDLSQEEGYG